jgi:formylglycine-generating enzyme required for sulfatase activity
VWDGGRLPTDAEWNLAAAAGAEQRVYPWGTGLDDTYAIWNCAYAPPAYACNPTTFCSIGGASPCDGIACAMLAGTCMAQCNPTGCSFADIAPPGSRSTKGDGKYGQADLAGNMRELVLDNDQGGDPKPCADDCFSPVVKVLDSLPRIRGGGWASTADVQLSNATVEHMGNAQADDPSVGFRCARD